MAFIPCSTKSARILLVSLTMLWGPATFVQAQQNTRHSPPQSFFSRGQTLSTEGGLSGSIVLGDFNGDGKLDLAVTNICPIVFGVCDVSSQPSSFVTTRLGKGDGTFGRALISNAGNGQINSMVIGGDFNHDGKLDLGISSLCTFLDPVDVFGEVHAAFGLGDGTFGSGIVFSANCPPSPYAITAGDFNLDGNQDLAATFFCIDPPTCKVGAVGVSLGLGDFNFLDPVFYPYGGAAPAQVAAGDFNGDGKPDLAVGDLFGTVTILWGNGDGTFQVGTQFALGGFIVADFNGDGRSDLVGPIGNQLVLLLAADNNTFRPAIPIESAPGALAAADFNCDGKLDLVVSNANGITVLLGNGRGKFRAVRGFDPLSGALAVGDLNNDGKPDLVVDDNTLIPAHTTVLLNVSSSGCRASNPRL